MSSAALESVGGAEGGSSATTSTSAVASTTNLLAPLRRSSGGSSRGSSTNQQQVGAPAGPQVLVHALAFNDDCSLDSPLPYDQQYPPTTTRQQQRRQSGGQTPTMVGVLRELAPVAGSRLNSALSSPRNNTTSNSLAHSPAGSPLSSGSKDVLHQRPQQPHQHSPHDHVYHPRSQVPSSTTHGAGLWAPPPHPANQELHANVKPAAAIGATHNTTSRTNSSSLVARDAISEIIPQFLYLSSVRGARNGDEVKRLGISAFLNVAREVETSCGGSDVAGCKVSTSITSPLGSRSNTYIHNSVVTAEHVAEHQHGGRSTDGVTETTIANNSNREEGSQGALRSSSLSSCSAPSAAAAAVAVPPPPLCLKLPIEDSSKTHLMEHLGKAIHFIETCRERGARVLVYCQEGRSRSASIVIGYLIHVLEMSYSDALDFIRAARPSVDPNIGFCSQLASLSDQVQSGFGSPIQVPPLMGKTLVTQTTAIADPFAEGSSTSSTTSQLAPFGELKSDEVENMQLLDSPTTTDAPQSHTGGGRNRLVDTSATKTRSGVASAQCSGCGSNSKQRSDPPLLNPFMSSSTLSPGSSSLVASPTTIHEALTKCADGDRPDPLPLA